MEEATTLLTFLDTWGVLGLLVVIVIVLGRVVWVLDQRLRKKDELIFQIQKSSGKAHEEYLSNISLLRQAIEAQTTNFRENLERKSQEQLSRIGELENRLILRRTGE